MRFRSILTTVAATALLWLAMAAPASACPMCKLANESKSRLPRAYMYSILFMMGMPAMLTTGFAVGFYRLSRKAARMRDEASAFVDTDSLDNRDDESSWGSPPEKSDG